MSIFCEVVKHLQSDLWSNLNIIFILIRWILTVRQLERSIKIYYCNLVVWTQRTEMNLLIKCRDSWVLVLIITLPASFWTWVIGNIYCVNFTIIHKCITLFINLNTKLFVCRNLQTAICCYLDYTLPPKLPSMSLKAAQTQEAAVGPGAW